EHLQWLLAEDAERAFESAKEIFAKEAKRPDISPELALQAAFCELASLDENQRFYRLFRTPAEIARDRFPLPAKNASGRASDPASLALPNGVGPLADALDHALKEFTKTGLLSKRRSGAWNVTHEALLRNWPRVAAWVKAEDQVRR